MVLQGDKSHSLPEERARSIVAENLGCLRMSTFDNEFDQAMAEADDTIWSAFGVMVKVNGGEAIQAVYDESLNEFDAMAGLVRKLSFKTSDGVRPRKGDKVEFVSTGRTLTVTSGPYPDGGNIQVIL
ncbi:head-tail joining protein [Vibrio cortegadensis]|uniref:head-tail joining protein n=2 Tax=Vibrio cortegadensis TaxID=1328770 RepID=UPI0021C3358F|nr:head-tail joining protein [Vibrio cortegadensis]